MLTLLKSTPSFWRTSTTRAENPHMGILGFPFMYSITRLLSTCSWIIANASSSPSTFVFFCGEKSSCDPEEKKAAAILGLDACWRAAKIRPLDGTSVEEDLKAVLAKREAPTDLVEDLKAMEDRLESMVTINWGAN